GAEGQGESVGVVEGAGQLAGGRVPHLHRVVIARRGQLPAVGAEGHAPNEVGVALEGVGQLAGGRVPHLHRLVLARRGQPLAVGAEGHAGDRRGGALGGQGGRSRG